MKFFLSNPRSTVYQANSPIETVQFLFSVETLFGRVVPSIAKFLGFSKTEELGFYSLNPSSKDLKLIEPETPWGEDAIGFQDVNIADYNTGKLRTARDDSGNTWTCTITIPATAWSSVISQQSAADPAKLRVF